MLSILYYLFLIVLCTLMVLISLVALVVCYPFDKPRRVVHEISRAVVRTFWAIPPFWRFRIEGMERVNKKGKYVIVINHQAMTDIPALYFVPLNFRWVSKREVFKIPFFGQMLRLHGDICIDRGKASEARDQLLREGKRWLDMGVSIAIFPEGTRSKDGEIHRFKSGAFELAQSVGVEILPVVLNGTDKLVKSSKLFKWRNVVTVKVLEPISVERVKGSDVRELSEEVRVLMAEARAEIRKKE
ncbi:MAG: lysophospholipid acyltransferase family protein [Alistipes sp.]|nr:lysophospholipid acyltransferase family protein [Alistipes sp.]